MGQPVEIAKIDHDKRQLFGWANVSVRKNGTVVCDWQEDVMPMDELEQAAYAFALDYRDAGENHTPGVYVGKMIESFVVTKEKLEKMGLAPDALPQGWWVGFQIEDDMVWEKVKKGDYRMFSIEGTAVREPV